MLPVIFVFKSGAAGWLELPGELPPPEFPEFSAPDLPPAVFPQDTCKAEKKQGAGHQAEGDADPGGGVHEKWFRHDVDQKIGPRIELQRSLVKKILWKIIKYFVKSVEMIPASRAVTPRNKTVPAQSVRGAGVLTEP